MSGGFPTRSSLGSFGPFPRENAIPVKDLKRQLDAESFSLLMWQVSGLSQVIPKAWAVLEGSGSAVTLLGHGESWNPQPSSNLAPVVSFLATGRYQIQYYSHAQDDSGNLIEITFDFPVSLPMSAGGLSSGLVQLVTNVSFTDFTGVVEIADRSTGTLVNGRVLVAVF